MIRVIDAAVSGEMCDMFRLFVALAEKNGVLGRCAEGYRECDMLPMPNGLADSKDAIFAFYAAIKPHVTAYREEMRFLETATRIEQTNIVRYMPATSDKFHSHFDSWDLKSATRQLSIVLYLNTVEKGGETVFVRQDKSVQPIRGRLLLFPSSWTHPHEARPPISEPKYAMITWLHLDVQGLGYWTEPF